MARFFDLSAKHALVAGAVGSLGRALSEAGAAEGTSCIRSSRRLSAAALASRPNV